MKEVEKSQDAPPWLIDNIEKASIKASKTYFLFLSFLAYCALTVVSTTDRQIILNEPVKLPIINVEIDLVGFFIVAPLLIIFIFIYFQLYLKRLTGLINDLRTNFAPTRKRRLYPWLFNIAEDPEPGIIGRLQQLIIHITMWWLLPVVIYLFFLWSLKQHQKVFSHFLGGMILLGFLVVIFFGLSSGWKQMKTGKKKGILFAISIFLIIYVPLHFIGINKACSGDWTRVNLSYQILVDIPYEDFPGIYWLDLNGVHLEGANLISTVLKRADLEDAKFRKAILVRANLSGANLTGADFTEAILWRADFTEADLSKSDFTKAFLTGADLTGAVLWSADFTGTKLGGANLSGASLRVTKNLTIEQLSKVKTLYNVKDLDPELMKLIKEKHPNLLEEPKEEPIKADKK